jgi:hypothetical protein
MVGIHRKLQHPEKKTNKGIYTKFLGELQSTTTAPRSEEGGIREEEEDEDEDEGKSVAYYSIVDSFYNPSSTVTT